MASLSTPQSQAGVMSFYDAAEKGPKINAKLVLVLIVVVALVVMFLDRVVTL